MAIAALSQANADINARDKRGATPLHYATLANAKGAAAVLVHDGADVNAKNKHGWTPLHYAAFHAKTPLIAKMLIEHGADVNAKDKYGDTPLCVAMNPLRRNAEIEKLLIENGATR